MRDGLGKDLEIRFSDCDRKAQKKTDSKDQWEIFCACERSSNLVSNWCHGLLSSQREKAHTDNQHQGSDKKGQEKIRLHRGNVQAQNKDDNNDW